MAANGYRASRSRPGAHEAVGRYARAVIEGEYAADAKAFDRMRKHRNRTEYGSWMVPAATLEADSLHAARLIEAVAKDLGTFPH